MMKNKSNKYRHEYKYFISDSEAVILRKRIEKLMPLDKHVGPSGVYLITSLYFDDYYDSCLTENENGTDPREKLRIRIYNHDTSRIRLECKRKERGKTLKRSARISKEQVEDIINGQLLKYENDIDPLLIKFGEQQRSKMLVPKVIVEYERIPYIYSLGNVRVTFDRYLSSSNRIENFLSGDYMKRPVMPAGKLLLEVKFDEYLPDYLHSALQLDNLVQTAFSKYYLCRKVGL